MSNADPSQGNVAPTALATAEEWKAAWDTFNAGLKQLRRLAVQDGITIKLSIPTIGAKKKKAKKS